MNSKLLDSELRQLSSGGMTVTLLNALDFVIPGDYNNSTQMNEMVRFVANNPGAVRATAISKRAEELFAADEGAKQRHP